MGKFYAVFCTPCLKKGVLTEVSPEDRHCDLHKDIPREDKISGPLPACIPERLMLDISKIPSHIKFVKCKTDEDCPLSPANRPLICASDTAKG